jgi:ribosomal protein L29
MFVQGTTPRTVSWGGLLALLGTGAFLLPVTPTRAQQPPAVAEPIRLRVVADDDAVKARVNEASIERLTAELEKKRAELAKLEAALKAAQAGKQASGAGTEKSGVKDVIVWRIVDGKAVEAKPGEQPKNAFEPKVVQIQVDPKAKPDEVKEVTVELEYALQRLGDQLYRTTPQRPLVIEVTVDGKKQVIELPPGSRVVNPVEPPKVPAPPVKLPAAPEPKGQYAPVPVPPGAPADAPRIVLGLETRPGDTDKRVAEIEKKLAEIVRELENLRKDLKANPAAQPLRIPNYQPAPLPPAERK